MEKLFDLSTLYSTPGTAKEPGIGLGLIICQSLVSKIGGEIWINSVFRQGTSVRFTVPGENSSPVVLPRK